MAIVNCCAGKKWKYLVVHFTAPRSAKNKKFFWSRIFSPLFYKVIWHQLRVLTLNDPKCLQMHDTSSMLWNVLDIIMLLLLMIQTLIRFSASQFTSNPLRNNTLNMMGCSWWPILVSFFFLRFCLKGVVPKGTRTDETLPCFASLFSQEINYSTPCYGWEQSCSKCYYNLNCPLIYDTKKP